MRSSYSRKNGPNVFDATLVMQTISLIYQGHSAAWAWQHVLNERVSQMQHLDDPILAGRAVDLSDIGQRVLHHLTGAVDEQPVALDEPAILVAEDLTPSDTATLDPDMVLGLCTARGGPTSHTAILARGFGLPAVVAAYENRNCDENPAGPVQILTLLGPAHIKTD